MAQWTFHSLGFRHRKKLCITALILVAGYALRLNRNLKMNKIPAASYVHVELRNINEAAVNPIQETPKELDNQYIHSNHEHREKQNVLDTELAKGMKSNQPLADNIKPNYSRNIGFHSVRNRQDHFVYVKIEKTGSSTFSNIFSSYGYRHGLNMMMSLSSKGLVNTSVMTPGISWDIGPDREHPNIMEQHARFNGALYHKYFPNKTVYITTIRDPVKWFISFVDFMGIYRSDTPREVLSSDRLFHKVRGAHSPLQLQKFVHNNFLQFLGFDVYKSDSLIAIKDYIEFIDKEFLLVMLTDYFDESLILLKRLMNWSMADIFYTYANEAVRKSGTIFSEQERAKLLDENHNLGDWLLYQHFNKTFWEKVGKQPKFYEEVRLFKKLQLKVREFCFSEELRIDTSIKLQISTQEELIEFGDKDCLAIRVRDGKALEFSAALDVYCPFRGLHERRTAARRERQDDERRSHLRQEAGRDRHIRPRLPNERNARRPQHPFPAEKRSYNKPNDKYDGDRRQMVMPPNQNVLRPAGIMRRRNMLRY